MTQLSQHFTFEELTTTEILKYVQPNWDAAQQYKDILTKLCNDILEPLRAQFGPIKVDSGFRCVALNKAIGGSMTSQHTLGQAADVLQVANTSYEGCVEMFNWAKNNLQVHQGLLERGCLHLALPTGENDNQWCMAHPSETTPNLWIKDC